MKGPFKDSCIRDYYLWLAFLMAGWVEGIRRALVLSLVLIAGTAIEQALSVGPPLKMFNQYIVYAFLFFSVAMLFLYSFQLTQTFSQC